MRFDHNSSPGGGRDPDFGFAFNNRNFSDRVLRIEIVANLTEANGDEAAVSGDDSNRSEDASTALSVKTLHISSLILAAHSPFFYKLFANGMMESEQQHVTLRINAFEEASLMELLNFMYSNTLRANTVPALLKVLVAADKFEVTSCIRHCCSLLRNMALTPESALLYLDLPSSILTAEAFQPLMQAAKQFLTTRYKDVSNGWDHRHRDEIMNLPLAGIEAILSSDDLQVASEDAVFDMALNWTLFHYQNNPDKRRDILSTRLGRYIRFRHMSPQKLREVLTCEYFDKDFAAKVVLDASFLKGNPPHRRRTLDMELTKYHPMTVIELPSEHCIVHLELKQEECAGLFPSGQICFHPLLLGGPRFFLSANCYMDLYHNLPCFGLYLGVQEWSSATSSFDYEFSAKLKPTGEYMSMCKGKYDFTGGNAGEYRSLFLRCILWEMFMADYSPYFINGVFHLRAELTVKFGFQN